MLRIRLQRVGRKNQPSFRLVVLDGREGPKTGRVIENIGFYNPITKERGINTERATYWVSVGAQPTGTVHNMLVDAGIVKDKKQNVLPKKSPVVKASSNEAKAETSSEKVSAPEGASESPKETEVEPDTASPEPKEDEEQSEKPEEKAS